MSAPARKAPRPFVATPGQTFIRARVHGTCSGCGTPFAAGASITRVYGRGGWVAPCCATGTDGRS